MEHGARVERLLILGSTGSIGTQALDVCSRSEELELVGLSAERSWETLSSRRAPMGWRGSRSPTRMPPRARREAWTDGEVLAGAEGLVRLVVESGRIWS